MAQGNSVLFCFLLGTVAWSWRGKSVMNQDLAGQALSHLSSVDSDLGAREQESYITKISNCQHQGVNWLFSL